MKTGGKQGYRPRFQQENRIAELELATSTGLSLKQIKEAQDLVAVHLEEITHAWNTHFPS